MNGTRTGMWYVAVAWRCQKLKTKRDDRLPACLPSFSTVSQDLAGTGASVLHAKENKQDFLGFAAEVVCVCWVLRLRP